MLWLEFFNEKHQELSDPVINIYRKLFMGTKKLGWRISTIPGDLFALQISSDQTMKQVLGQKRGTAPTLMWWGWASLLPPKYSSRPKDADYLVVVFVT